MSKPNEVIIIHETVIQSWVHDASSAVMFVALIGIGVYLQSGAMQWAGAILGFLTISGQASTYINKNKMTVAQARKRLDEIEAAN